jgi:putative tryptophan/tyrosine transport system substrate-binding protein
MNRRTLIATLGGTAVVGPSVAQTPRRARLGYLSGGMKGDDASLNTIGVLQESLGQLGWRIGDTLEIDEAWAGGDFGRLPRLAGELVAQKPNVLVATGATETEALRAATQSIPIVFMQISTDPVSLGLVKSIARPGGNITGFMQGPQVLWAKRIELLTELVGRPLKRLAWLGNPGNASSDASWADARDAAAKFGNELNRIDVGSADDIDRALAGLKDRDALLVQYDFLLSTERRRVAAFVARLRLPAIYENRIQTLAGGLMSYGGDLRENYRQGASYVHRVLNGTSVSDLPVVQASRFELVINIRTAKALGLTVPAALIARADEVIE